MASLHADLHSIPEEPFIYCDFCGEDVVVCDMLDECNGRWRRAAEKLS